MAHMQIQGILDKVRAAQMQGRHSMAVFPVADHHTSVHSCPMSGGIERQGLSVHGDLRSADGAVQGDFQSGSRAGEEAMQCRSSAAGGSVSRHFSPGFEMVSTGFKGTP